MSHVHVHVQPLPPCLDFSRLGPSFAQVLAALPGLSDAAVNAMPREWTSLASLLWTLIEDEGMTSEMAAHEASVPVSLVREYRDLVGL